MDLSANSDREGEEEFECQHTWDVNAPCDDWQTLLASCTKCGEFQHPQATQTDVPTFTAAIYLGLKERESGQVRSVDEVRDELRRYCDSVGFCVSLTPTEFIYTDGSEPGVIVGLINYPRFPSSHDVLWQKALTIAAYLQYLCGQLRVSVVGPTLTTMLTAPSEEK